MVPWPRASLRHRPAWAKLRPTPYLCDCKAKLFCAASPSLSGAAALVVVLVYTLEGCGGGNNGARLFGVFAENGARIIAYRVERPPAWSVDTARVIAGRIEVAGLAYGPNDPRCCPTLRRSSRYMVDGRTVVPAH